MAAIPEPTTELWLWLRTFLDENIWPSTDEAVVLQLANDWGSAAQAMTDLITEARAANNALPGVWPDSVGTIYHRNVGSTLDDYATMVQAYRDMEKLCRDFARQVAALRNSIIAELIVNVALFAALALFPGAGLLMGRFASQLALRLMGYSRAAVAAMEAPATVVPAALRVGGELVSEGLEEMGVSLLGDGLSIAQGYQKDFNFGQMWISGGAGLLGAGAAPLLRPVGQMASFPAGRLTERLGAPPGLTRTVEETTSAFVVNGISSPWAGTTVQALADGRLPTWSEYGRAIVNQGPLAGMLASSRVGAINGGVATGNFLRGNGFTLPNPQLGGVGHTGSSVPIGDGGGPGGTPPDVVQGDAGSNSLARGPGQPPTSTPTQTTPPSADNSPTSPSQLGGQNPSGEQQQNSSSPGQQTPTGDSHLDSADNTNIAQSGTRPPAGAGPPSPTAGQTGSAQAPSASAQASTGAQNPNDPLTQDTAADQSPESLPASDAVQEAAPTDEVNPAVPSRAGALAAAELGGTVGPPGEGVGDGRGDGNPWFDASVPFGPPGTDPLGNLNASVMLSFGRNKATWAVGEDGRVRRVTARLREDHAGEDPGTKSRHNLKAVKDAHGIDGDSGGHLLARRFFRNDELHNLFAQNRKFNSEVYERLEDEWGAWIAEGYEVEVEILPGPGKARPTSITVTYTVYDTSGDQQQAVWSSGRTFVNTTGQSYHGYLATKELRAMEGAGTYRLGANEVTRTVGEDGVVDKVTTVLRTTNPRLPAVKKAAGRAFAIRLGVPLDADGNVLGHRLFGPGGVAHLVPPGVVVDPADYARLEEEWLAQLADGQEVTVVSTSLSGPSQITTDTPDGPGAAEVADGGRPTSEDGPTGSGRIVHAPEVPGTRFVADGGAGAGTTGDAAAEAVRAALSAVESDFGGLIAGQPGQAAEGVVIVRTANGPQYFEITRVPVPAGRAAATTVREGSVRKPHLVRIPMTLAGDQLTRAWVHEISHTLQEMAAPRSRLQRLLRRPSAQTEDLCVVAQFNEFRLLSRQLAAARTDEEIAALPQDLEGLVESIGARHQPPDLPWLASPAGASTGSSLDAFVAEASTKADFLHRRLDELDALITAKTEAVERAAESAQQAEQTAADALQAADSGRFARAHQAGKDAAKHAEVRAWHEQVAAAYREARQQLETVAEGYRSLVADAASMTPDQRTKATADLVNELAAYEQRLAKVTPPLAALPSLLPTDWLPHLRALTDQVNAVLAANHVDHRLTAGSLQHRLNAEFGQAVTSDGAILRVGHARPIELRFRLSVSELAEVLDPSVRASETMLGLLPQPSRKHATTQNGKVGASGAFGLSQLTQLFGEHSWVHALGQLVTVKGEQSSSWGRSVTSTGAQYGQDGAVEDNRGESSLYAGQASWQVEARRPGEPDRLLADVTVDRGQGKDVSRLRAWVSHAYTLLAPTETFTNGTIPSGRIPNHTLTSLDGLQSLTDRVFSEYGDQLDRFGDQASLLREQIQSAIANDLPSRLAESTEQAIIQPLQADGRPVGHLQIKTDVRYELVGLVGQPSTTHWQERVRVGLSNASGQQNFSAGTTVNATVGYGGKALTDLGDTSVDLGPSATAGRSVNRSESLSGGGVGIHVGVQRYTGPTQGYRMVFEHKVTLVLDGESQGTVKGETEALVRLHTNDAYRHGLPVAESAFVHDHNGNRLLHNGVPVLRGDPRTGVDVPGRRLELPNWLANGTSPVSGTGPGLAQRVTGGEEALADLVGPLTERGFLPPLDDQGNPDLARMTTDPLLRQGQLLNLTELRTQLSVNRLEAGYDIAVQSGILVTLTKPETGHATETITLRIDLRTGPPSSVGVTDDEAMVTLNIGSDTASRTDGWAKSLPWNASPLGLTHDAPGGAEAAWGWSYGRQALGRLMGWFSGGTLNQVTLVESRSPVAAFEVPHRIEVVELGAEPVVLHTGTPGTSARILVDTDLLPSTEVAPTQVSSGPVSDEVLDRATLVALDTHELDRRVQVPGSQDSAASHHAAALLDPRHLLAHPEWARTTYRTDALVRGAGPVSSRGSLAVNGRIGDVVLLGTTDAVVGDINLALTSHGLSAGRSTGGQTSAAVGATGDVRGGKLAGEYGTTTSASRTDQTIAGVERLTIEVGRHYLFAGTAGLAVTADGKPETADATVVFQIAERDVLQFHLDGELTLPLEQVADAVERYLNGSLELDRRLAAGLVRQYRVALATAEAAGDPVPRISASHTPRVLLEKLQPQLGKPTPRSKADQLDLVVAKAERIDATRTVEIPEHYRANLGSSLVEQASVTEQGRRVTLFDKVRVLMGEQLGVAPESDPMLAEALAVDLSGKRWWGRLEDMLGPDGFTRTYPVGQPSRLGAQQVRLRIRAEFTDESVSLGATRKTISIVQRYLYDERTASTTNGRSGGLGVDGGWQEGRTGSIGTDRTGSTTVAVGEQTTRLERIATFDGQHRVRRGLKFTVELMPEATATPARTPVGRALTRTQSPLTPLPPTSLAGEVIQLIPLRVLPETGAPVAPGVPIGVEEPTGALNERGVPDAYFVEDARSNELTEVILRELTTLLGRAGMRVHRSELAVMLSTATLNASFSRMAQDEGFAVLRLPLPGYTSQTVEVRVGATVVGARLVGGPVDDVEIGEVNRSQYTVTHTVNSGRLLPVDGGAKLQESGLGASAGVTAGDQLVDQTTDARGVRRERTRSEKGRAVTARVEIEYDVQLVKQELRRSGEIRATQETEVKQAPRGVAYLTMFESDYRQLERFLTSTLGPGGAVDDFEARLRGQRPMPARPLSHLTNLVTDLEDEDDDKKLRQAAEQIRETVGEPNEAKAHPAGSGHRPTG